MSEANRKHILYFFLQYGCAVFSSAYPSTALFRHLCLHLFQLQTHFHHIFTLMGLQYRKLQTQTPAFSHYIGLHSL